MKGWTAARPRGRLGVRAGGAAGWRSGAGVCTNESACTAGPRTRQHNRGTRHRWPRPERRRIPQDADGSAARGAPPSLASGDVESHFHVEGDLSDLGLGPGHVSRSFCQKLAERNANYTHPPGGVQEKNAPAGNRRRRAAAHPNVGAAATPVRIGWVLGGTAWIGRAPIEAAWIGRAPVGSRAEAVGTPVGRRRDPKAAQRRSGAGDPKAMQRRSGAKRSRRAAGGPA